MRRPRGVPPATVVVEAAAKVNVGWRVGSRRADGYHEVHGLVQTVSLTDRLHIRVGEAAGRVVDNGVGLSVKGPEASEDLLSADNLVLRAAALLGNARPTSLTLTKNIPVAAGLGGGSADAAAALVGLAMVWRGKASGADLLDAAAQLGSDVPAILVGGLVAVGGRGEKVRSVGCGSGYALVLGVLDARLGAAEVYARFDEIGGGEPRGFHHNDLEAAAVAAVPGIRRALDVLADAGAGPVFVSGSGPVVVGVCPDPHEAGAVAERASGSFRAVHVVAPSAWGVRMQLGG